MTQSVTEYAARSGENTEHIWRRKLTKGLYKSLCGMLSDGTKLVRVDDPVRCALCNKIQVHLVRDEMAQVRHA